MSKPDLEHIAEAVKSAPSIFNSQPWSLKPLANNLIELHARLDEPEQEDQRRWDISSGADGQRHLDPLAREFTISCGAALYNLRPAIRVTGHDLAVRLPPYHPARDSTLLAVVEIMTERVKAPTKPEQELYEAIWRRQTNRWPTPRSGRAPPRAGRRRFSIPGPRRRPAMAVSSAPHRGGHPVHGGVGSITRG